MIKLEDLTTKCNPTWCPGCGNFGIWGAFKNAVVKQGWDNTNSVLVAGIGLPWKFLSILLNLLLLKDSTAGQFPVATGIKLANHKLNVFCFFGRR